MTVAQLQQTITTVEWMRWSIYYGRKAQDRQLAARGG